VLGEGAGKPRSRDRSLLNTVTIIKAKGKKAKKRGRPGSK